MTDVGIALHGAYGACTQRACYKRACGCQRSNILHKLQIGWRAAEPRHTVGGTSRCTETTPTRHHTQAQTTTTANINPPPTFPPARQPPPQPPTCSVGSSGTQAPPTSRAAPSAASSWRSSAARSKPKMWGSCAAACCEVNTRNETSRLRGDGAGGGAGSVQWMRGANSRQRAGRATPQAGTASSANANTACMGGSHGKVWSEHRWHRPAPAAHLWLALVLPKVGGRRGRR